MVRLAAANYPCQLVPALANGPRSCWTGELKAFNVIDTLPDRACHDIEAKAGHIYGATDRGYRCRDAVGPCDRLRPARQRGCSDPPPDPSAHDRRTQRRI